MTELQVNDIQTMLNQVERAEEYVRQLPGSTRWQSELNSLHQRLERRERVVAVFGAFSAGKSSLLNAVLGKPALAVSPNPTTASVSHLYADANKEVGSAVVYAKSADQMWEDVRQAFHAIHQFPSSLEEAVAIAEKLKMSDFSSSARKSVSFLMAVAKGYQTMKERLGTHWVIPESEVRAFTAEERFACYVQRVDIVQDADVLKDGFVFVDTPGVDSIHRRHTDVAFDYMRKADAIIFVLYYTHAFSRADKDFLLQLSGVQDVAGTDKLFVAINAVDLAKSEEERQAVRDRVINELKQVGIRRPRVFEVSSQLAFAASQLEKNPQDTQFEKLARMRLRLSDDAPLPTSEDIRAMSGVRELVAELTTFVNQKSETLLREACERTLRSVGQKVSAGCQRAQLSANEDNENIERMKSQYEEFTRKLETMIDDLRTGKAPEQERLTSDWQELVFHAGERIRLKFSTLFREAFHPARFRGGSDSRSQLRDAAAELIRTMERQVEIEARTFALRADAALNGALQSVRERAFTWMTSHGISGLQYEEETFEGSLADSSVRAELSVEPVTVGFRHFSSPKQFFEGGGAGEMIRVIEEKTVAMAREELERLTSSIREEGIASFAQKAVRELTSMDESATLVRTEELRPTPDTELTLWNEAAEWFESQVS